MQCSFWNCIYNTCGVCNDYKNNHRKEDAECYKKAMKVVNAVKRINIFKKLEK